MPKADQPTADHAVTFQSITDQFWQYAKEAALSAAAAKTDDDRQSLLELARTWTQAALQQRHSSAHPNTGLPPLPSHLLNLIERYRKVRRTSQSYRDSFADLFAYRDLFACRDTFAPPRFAAREEAHHVC
jgi:hypothetical protein